MRAALAGVGLCLGLSLGAAFPVSAQQMGVIQSDVLVIDPERMLLESDYGKRLQAEIQAERDRLIAYNEKVAQELEAEEQRLTALRSTTPANEFRELADAFDQRVEELRLESERLSRELERRRELIPIQFMRVVQPVLTELLNEANAMVMIDGRTVMLHTSASDVTELAVQRINARIGVGPLTPDQSAPTKD
ncbi:periplasmic chaperone for outer membrane protein Skp [Roseovarius mucosus DSM 17069]|uniref:Periplasmic chaperone for outer membrane protein Skp n=1 Tax=Roseovarius mucosus DSM 17069 TaxID=1288298 RepID=A0A0A0HNB3_9RHOB|nr:OmpH family outer membrane protein [Roseovarius mucosus]KGM88700.1 periplasmic chaperone for outer membrane protein Skp [Roseovarius mucosus DSM 17069]